ncbi:hypothetical protein Glo7428_4516 [Gloeocapsa sp. PCC 7428]|nr:hypothetical protein Glo7428_4516 [Gloeocapsa sp. PCC 7428]
MRQVLKAFPLLINYYPLPNVKTQSLNHASLLMPLEGIANLLENLCDE